MDAPFQILQHSLLTPGASIYQGDEAESASVSLRDPARSVFTDFHHIRPFSIGSAATLAEVNDKMIACGVRLLFVADASGDGLSTFDWIYEDDGTYTVALRVEDASGDTSEIATAQVTVADRGPTAAFNWSPGTQEEGSPVMFGDASTGISGMDIRVTIKARSTHSLITGPTPCA